MTPRKYGVGQYIGSFLTFNSNGASTTTQRRLENSTRTLRSSFERLSSGLRINRASDDAAGLAVSSLLNVDARVYSQAIRNTNDGISLLSVAEGSLNSLREIVFRLRELAEQSSNGVLTRNQRRSIDAEAQALAREYQRIKRTTSFNGMNLLDNSAGELSIQAGYSTLNLSGGQAGDGTFAAGATLVSASSYGSGAVADLNGDGKSDYLFINPNEPSYYSMLGNGDGTFRIASKPSIVGGGTGGPPVVGDFNGDGNLDFVSGDKLSFYAGNGDGTFKVGVLGTASYHGGLSTTDVNGDGNLDLLNMEGSLFVRLGNGDGSFRAQTSYGASDLYGAQAILGDLNGDGILDAVAGSFYAPKLTVFWGNANGSFSGGTSISGVSIGDIDVGDINGDGKLDIVSADYYNASPTTVFLSNGNGTFALKTVQYATNSTSGTQLVDTNGDGILDILQKKGAGLVTSIGNGDGTFKAGVVSGMLTGGTLDLIDANLDGIIDVISGARVLFGNGVSQGVVAPTLHEFSLLTQETSLEALTAFSHLQNRLGLSLGAIGASQSRLDTATSLLYTSRTNFQQAASQITDVDVAEESSALTRANIIQNAGAAVLAQANLQPQIALQLLGRL